MLNALILQPHQKQSSLLYFLADVEAVVGPPHLPLQSVKWKGEDKSPDQMLAWRQAPVS